MINYISIFATGLLCIWSVYGPMVLKSDVDSCPRLSKRTLLRRTMTGLEEYEEAKAGRGLRVGQGLATRDGGRAIWQAEEVEPGWLLNTVLCDIVHSNVSLCIIYIIYVCMHVCMQLYIYIIYVYQAVRIIRISPCTGTDFPGGRAPRGGAEEVDE